MFCPEVIDQVDEFDGSIGSQGRLRVRIRMIEILIGDDALLRDVQQFLVAGSESEQREGAKKYRI